VADATIVSWVQDTLAKEPSGWAYGVSGLGKSSPASSGPSSSDAAFGFGVSSSSSSGGGKGQGSGKVSLGAAAGEEEDGGEGDVVEEIERRAQASNGGGGASVVGAPLTPGQRKDLRDRLISAWKWNESLELLHKYYAGFGHGLTGSSTFLRWDGDGLVGLTLAAARSRKVPLVGLDLSEMLRTHARGGEDGIGGPVRHCVLSGPRAEIATTLPTEGLRVVFVPPEKADTLGALCRSLAVHPRVRFVCLFDDPGVKVKEGTAAEAALLGLLTGLSPAGDALPENVMCVFLAQGELAGRLGPFCKVL
jgi:hypothetical protein